MECDIMPSTFVVFNNVEHECLCACVVCMYIFSHVDILVEKKRDKGVLFIDLPFLVPIALLKNNLKQLD